MPKDFDAHTTEFIEVKFSADEAEMLASVQLWRDDMERLMGIPPEHFLSPMSPSTYDALKAQGAL